MPEELLDHALEEELSEPDSESPVVLVPERDLSGNMLVVMFQIGWMVRLDADVLCSLNAVYWFSAADEI